MKIAFLQKYPFPYFGIMSLSASLPAEYEREVFIGDLEEAVVSEIVRYRPDVLALPLLTLEYPWMLETAGRIREKLPGLITVAGYIHATSCPEIIGDERIDAVCVGEGENSFPRFLKALAEKGELEAVDGFRVKKGGEIIESGDPSLVPDLDALPAEDRSIYYDKYRSLAAEDLKHFMTSRGCPFSCSFCCHHVYRELYGAGERYVRRKSPEKVIREIKRVRDLYGLSTVCFLDDFFSLDVKWLKTFTDLYRREISLPYFCAVTPPAMTEEVARILKESGCHTVNFGLETASEKKRFDILNKRFSDEQIVNCARLIKQYGMKIQTTNLFGLPHETVEEAFDNIRFNIKIGTDFMCANVLLPFPATEIERIALEAGDLDPDYLESEEYHKTHPHLGSVFKFKEIETIEHVQKIAHLAVKFPFLLPVFKRLVRLKNRKLFFSLYVLSSMWRYKSEKPISWPEVLKVFWRSRKDYLRYA